MKLLFLIAIWFFLMALIMAFLIGADEEPREQKVKKTIKTTIFIFGLIVIVSSIIILLG